MYMTEYVCLVGHVIGKIHLNALHNLLVNIIFQVVIHLGCDPESLLSGSLSLPDK